VSVTQRARQVRSPYPLGVIVVVSLTALRCLTIVAGLAEFEGGPIAQWLRETSPLPEFRPDSDLELFARGVLIGLLVASVLVVIGLLARRRWAWVLAIISSGVILAIDIGWWWSGDPRYGSMFFNIIAVFYLNQRDVRLALRGLVATS
jgi:uncharacterized membrane protein YphA (DoxX/SURF4 family)